MCLGNSLAWVRLAGHQDRDNAGPPLEKSPFVKAVLGLQYLPEEMLSPFDLLFALFSLAT